MFNSLSNNLSLSGLCLADNIPISALVSVMCLILSMCTLIFSKYSGLILSIKEIPISENNLEWVKKELNQLIDEEEVRQTKLWVNQSKLKKLGQQ